MRTLKDTLNYRSDRVLNKFRTQYSVTRVEAEEIACEANRWLWLNARLNDDRKAGIPDIPEILVIHEGMVIIDEYWHAMVLDTRSYADFCEKYFGTFIHHTPAAPDFTPPTLEETESQLEYICNVAGEETLGRWYEEFPVRYSIERITQLQRPRMFGRPCEAFTS